MAGPDVPSSDIDCMVCDGQGETLTFSGRHVSCKTCEGKGVITVKTFAWPSSTPTTPPLRSMTAWDRLMEDDPDAK